MWCRRMARPLAHGALALAALLRSAVAQDSPRAQGPERVAVHCVDAEGRPVAGAEVHLWQSFRVPDGTNRLQASGPHRSGDDGVASTAVALAWDGGKFDRWAYARVPGKLVGAARVLRWDDSPVDPKLTIRLLPSREIRGQAHAPKGVRSEMLRVSVLALNAIVGDDVFGQPFPRNAEIDSLAHALPERFQCQCAADGSFVFADMPPRPLLVLAVEGPGVAQAQWGNALLPGRTIPDLIEIEALPEAVLGGVVRDAHGKPEREAEVELRISKEARSPILFAFRTRTDEDGRFRLTGLPAASFDLTVRSPAGSMSPRTVKLGPAQVVEDLAIDLEASVEVVGTVVALPGGVPVEGVGVSAIVDEQAMRRLGFARTDARGRFVLRLPEGKIRLYFSSVPAGFVRPEPQRTWSFEVRANDKDLQSVRLELERVR